MAAITFSIHYRTHEGERLYLSGAIPELGSWREDLALELYSSDGYLWQTTIYLEGRELDFDYKYIVKSESGLCLRREWKAMHRLLLAGAQGEVYAQDYWAERPEHSYFYSSAYYDVLCAHESESLKPYAQGEYSTTHAIIHCYAPYIDEHKRLYVSGSTKELGEWQPSEALAMQYIGRGQWYASIPTTCERLECKFFIADKYNESIIWEKGGNRCLQLPYAPEKRVTCYIGGLHFRLGADYQPRFAGVVCPLFSMRHSSDYGVGDFGSLRHAIDWAKTASLHVLQLLPINDTTYYRDWRDSYPYNAISVDAIHPIYIDISALKPLRNSQSQRLFEKEAERLRQSTELLYPEVADLKERYLRAQYNDWSQEVFSSTSYRSFYHGQKMWLVPYAAFCLLRDTPKLKEEYSTLCQRYDAEQALQLIQSDAYKEQANYYLYSQYLLHQQLCELRSYASSVGVLLKGDLPIGVAPHSIEVWRAPELFHLDRQAGAPPDDFALDGQNWGFPTYNWERMQEDGFTWWRERFARMSEYFHALRIDHILGFFRIWEIPKTQRSGLLGHFNPALPKPLAYWQERLGNIPADLLQYPCLKTERAEQIFAGSYLQLIEQGILQQVEGVADYLRLSHGKQRLWEEELKSKKLSDTAIKLLIELCTEVALIEDSTHEGLYHPRIAWERSELYQSWSLDMQEQWCRLSSNYFYEEHNELWRITAEARLGSLVESSDMLICAEDLGMIPATVPEVLNKLQILSLELERMPKGSTPYGWSNLDALPYLGVCTTSTHDMAPLRAWWQGLDRVRKAFYLNEQLGRSRIVSDSSEERIFVKVLGKHLFSPAMLAILPIQDWMSIDPKLHLHQAEEEQINHPEDPHQKWCYRLPIDLDKLKEEHSGWTSRIRDILQISNRE